MKCDQRNNKRLYLGLGDVCQKMIITRDQSFDDLPKLSINIELIKILGHVVLDALWSNFLRQYQTYSERATLIPSLFTVKLHYVLHLSSKSTTYHVMLLSHQNIWYIDRETLWYIERDI